MKCLFCLLYINLFFQIVGPIHLWMCLIPSSNHKASLDTPPLPFLSLQTFFGNTCLYSRSPFLCLTFTLYPNFWPYSLRKPLCLNSEVPKVFGIVGYFPERLFSPPWLQWYPILLCSSRFSGSSLSVSIAGNNRFPHGSFCNLSLYNFLSALGFSDHSVQMTHTFHKPSLSCKW